MKLIDQIDVKGAVVTIDAMGCRNEIAKKIRGAGGDFVFAVKDNQPTLYQAIHNYFSNAVGNERRHTLLHR